LEKKFYEKEKILFLEQLNIKKANFSLKQEYLNKNLNLESYDKRIFIKNNKSTTPLTIDN
jgi:hypothetical protein